VYLPDNVTNVSGRAFGGSKKLESISIGNKVSTFSEETFAECSALLHIHLRGKIIPSVFCPAFDYVPTKDNLTLEVDESCENSTICGRTPVRPEPHKKGLSSVMIGVISVGAALLVIVIVVIVVVCVKNRRGTGLVERELIVGILEKGQRPLSKFTTTDE
jgi:hypothetical protein